MAEYIDKDKLIEEIDEWLDSVGSIVLGKGLSSYGELLGCIEDAHTEDVVPKAEIDQLVEATKKVYANEIFETIEAAYDYFGHQYNGWRLFAVEMAALKEKYTGEQTDG